MKRRKKPLIILGIIVIVLLIIGARVRSNMHKAPIIPRTVTVTRGNLTVQVTETGTIAPDNQVDVKSKVAGRLLSIPIKEGDYVHTGQLIATVDTSQIAPQVASTKAQLDQAEARLAQSQDSYRLQVIQTQSTIDEAVAALHTSQAHLASVESGSRPQELEQQQEAVTKAQTDLDDAKRTQTRRQTLVAKGFISQSDADAADVAVQDAQTALESARAQLSLLKAGPKEQDIDEAKMGVDSAQVQLASARSAELQNQVRQSDVAQARASVDQIQNDLQQLDVQLADTRIVAPASGMVLKKYKQLDEIVQSATTSFSDADSLVVTLGSKPKVKVDINEVDIPSVSVGDPVKITVDSLPNAVFPGVVSDIAPVSSNSLTSSQTSGMESSVSKFPIDIAMPHPDPRLRPGMTVNVSIITDQHKNAVIAARETVPFKGSSGLVSVLEAGGHTVKKSITVGLRNDTQVEVLSGLNPGDKLVVVPIDASDRRKIDISGNDDDNN